MNGILFKDWKIKAVAGDSPDREWQTRRVIKPQPSCSCEQKHIAQFKGGSVNFFYEHHNTPIHYKPRYQVGEVVYIKEAWTPSHQGLDCIYKLDAKEGELFPIPIKDWKSPLFMPEWAARYFEKITDIRAERLQEITIVEAELEGFAKWGLEHGCSACETESHSYYGARFHFAKEWNTINPKYPWESNPWVFVYSFKKAEK